MGSFLFRMECIIYAIALNCIYTSMSFWIFSGISVIYVSLFLLFKLKYNKQFLRLIIDFCYILLALYGQPQENAQYFFLLLPMVNAVAYGGNHKSIMPLLLVTLFGIFYKDDFLIIGVHYVAPVILAMINYYAQKIRECDEAIREITANIDNYFVSQELYEKPYHIYKNLITILNKHLGDNFVQSISTYMQKEDRLILIDSSDFLWDRSFSLDRSDIVRLRKYKIIHLSAKHQQYSEMFYRFSVEKCSYIVRASVDNGRSSIFGMFFGDKILRIALGKLAVLQNTIYRVALHKQQALHNIKDSYNYVKTARSIMHYIRNVLSPIGNVLQFYSSDSLTQEQKDRMRSSMDKELKRAKKSYNGLIGKANFLLDTKVNPFSANFDMFISLKDLYSILFQIVDHQLCQGVFIDEESRRIADENKLYIKANDIEIHIMFTDWLANMRKYGNNTQKIEMSVGNSVVSVCFSNGCNEQDTNLENLIKDINSSQKEEIIASKSFGIANIVEIANRWNIGVEAQKINKNVEPVYPTGGLRLTFKIKLYDDKGISNENITH